MYAYCTFRPKLTPGVTTRHSLTRALESLFNTWTNMQVLIEFRLQ